MLISNSFSLALFFLFSMVPLCLLGQEKYERESRILEEEVPLPAQEFIHALAGKNGVKWYWEEGLNTFSIEAKFKINEDRYSVEFDTLGKLEDVELLLRSEEVIPADLYDKIREELGLLFSRYRIRKSQIQYTGESEHLLALIGGDTSPGSYTTKFEFVVKGRTEQGVDLYELLFNKEGQLLQLNKIVLKNAHNLEY